MSRNVSTTLRRRRRPDPMQAYDALPRPLRAWMAQAALPWSPASCRRIWVKARAEGASQDDILDRLARAERITLSRDRFSLHAGRAPIHDQQDYTT
ncbi:hypothetical protein JQX09_20395 [Sulfitobacter pseudonitzschiae]|uniref:Uncharacterized protein n=1 Tax=Pseudosulfitobacter pseudonitzschiae TaxID=1402135 RepID=A0A9Q2NLK8_9RHOB|nr:DUF6525 family protein [Pseudosulfitobacter pseudonitzschiae]MBM2294293.1 hypothetical protein [Pseudosulfitobacter pseudonitzschiae]MBM2299218.1 hypothetical protein [Pseudosulfitobacter pseudonitzschiae]MBM2304126.1 hypothetical protein [Pseudosulfitobacter pseudonitzschiae]MBM2313906.1 hypothetical protein [Pseudosulfitobacter pseudonitzschiae]MBM2318820.1 hypothetical protein [Pseudosulfitobacter pseudonitzschiae]